MTIVLCGGGSGGHITPLLAVARELRGRSENYKIVYVGEKRGKFTHIAEDSGLFDECHYISAGKLRRYHNESLLRRLTDVKTIFFNIRDLGRLTLGVIQSLWLFSRLKPGSVLLKGGYVCVPASIGAHFSKAFIVTHDSDALPGLSNRFAARYASIHATGMPTKYYSYPEASAREVGLPIDPNYKIYSEHEIRFLKEKLGFQADSQVVLVVGGSNGAKRLNQWCLEAFSVLLATHPKLNVLMVVGKGNLKQREIFSMDPVLKNRIKAIEFTSELYHLSAISDVIITRAGATTIAEFAAERKACILVPNPDLTGGHQLRNAAVYEDQGAALVIQEEDLKKSTDPLVEAVADLLNDTKQNKILGKKLNETLPLIDPSSALADILTSRGPRE